MNKKGFTLIELIAVIAILVIVITMAGPKLINLLNGKKSDALDSTKQIIISAARSYVIDYKIGTPTTITISELCLTNYLTCPIENAVTGEDINGIVTIDANNNYEVLIN